MHAPQPFVLEGMSAGLTSLANFVHRHVPGWKTTIVDLGHVPCARIRQELRAAAGRGAGPVVVGITTTSATYFNALGVAKAAKAVDPSWLVVLGGAHASPEDEVVLRTHRGVVDAVVRGEGERSLAELLCGFPNWRTAPGLSFLEGEDMVRTPAPPLLTEPELDELPPFQEGALSGVPLGRCGRVTYFSARGCPLGCAFCAVGRTAIRAKSIPAVLRDLEILVRGYGFMRIGIEDNFFAQSKRRTLALCQAISAFRRSSPGNRFRWDCQTRVESLADASVVRAMAEAGCDGVFLGVESLHPDILIELNKTRAPGPYLELLADRVVPEVLDAQVALLLNLQFGTPWETPAHRQRDLAILKRLGALASRAGTRLVVCPMLSVVYPGTGAFWRGISAGTWPRDIFEPFTEWEAETKPVRRWLGRHFAHGTGGIPTGILHAAGLRRREFLPDAERILAIDNHLRDLRTIEGIDVFDYEPFIVHEPGPGAGSPAGPATEVR